MSSSTSESEKDIEIARLKQQLAEMRSTETGRAVNDIIHGQNTQLPDLLWKIIDTPIFQRLRFISQLGTMPYVFPNATHSRFEHSLGVAFLAGKWCSSFRRCQPELGITTRDIHLVQIAGLLHDLGHGPFSHAFENGFICTLDSTKYNTDWRHEDASQALTKMLLEDLNETGATNFTPDEIRKIQCMISGEVPEDEEAKGRTFLYQIVSNKTNSIDVDKFDYLMRDNTAINPSYHMFSDQRLLQFSRVIDGEICFRKGQEENIYYMFISRFNLHKQIYTHKVVVAVDLMIGDILKLADPVLKISEIFKRGQEVDYKSYILLDDTIIRRIECSPDERLKKAQALIHRLRTRQLYKWVGWFRVDNNEAEELKAKLHSFLVQTKGLSSDDFVLQKQKFNFALKDQNPMSKVHYYKNEDVTQKFPISPEDVSELMIRQTEYVYLSVFVKKKELFDVMKQSYLQEFGERFRLATLQCSPKVLDSRLNVSQDSIKSRSPLTHNTSPIGSTEGEEKEKSDKVTKILQFE